MSSATVNSVRSLSPAAVVTMTDATQRVDSETPTPQHTPPSYCRLPAEIDNCQRTHSNALCTSEQCTTQDKNPLINNDGTVPSKNINSVYKTIVENPVPLFVTNEECVLSDNNAKEVDQKLNIADNNCQQIIPNCRNDTKELNSVNNILNNTKVSYNQVPSDENMPSVVLNKSDKELMNNNIGKNEVETLNRDDTNVKRRNVAANAELHCDQPDAVNTIDVSYKSSGVEFKPQIRWPDLLAQLFIHLGCLYGFILIFTSAKFYTGLWAFGTVYTTGFGITAGAHRLWSHKAYKAKWPLRLLLIFLFTITGQRDVYTWALDHRVHHKYSETDADPHNAKRGFFFAHVGWLFVTPHPDVVVKRAVVDMSDLQADPIVMWQKRLYIPLFALLVIALPVLVPYYYWNETLWNSFFINFNFRFCVTLNIAFFVNSVAHMWGNKPYDKYISPAENLAVAIAALGEGWHNYHHVFPWDYKTSELGFYTFNPSTAFIDFFAKIGWAYDRKFVSPAMVSRRAARSGDGSHDNVWGYGDADIIGDDLVELEKMIDKKQNIT